jgi:hypothetical protein
MPEIHVDRGLRLLAILCGTIACVTLAACESAVEPVPDVTNIAGSALAQQGAMPVRPTPPVILAQTPRYPAIAIYIVYREYLHRNPGLTTVSSEDRQYQQYIEKRMREIYPERGYAGMMRDATEEARQNRMAWQAYERDLREYERQMARYSGAQVLGSSTTLSSCGSTSVDPYADADPSWTGQEEYAVPPDAQLPTIQMEVDSLRLEGSEVDEIHYYESIATGTYAGGGGGGGPIHMEGLPEEPTADDLIRAAARGQTPYSSDDVTAQINPIEVGEALVAVAMVGWKAYRVWQSVKRARQKSEEFYPHLAYDDTRRDAHRHILWNMMLRRWVGRFWANEIGDFHERNTGGPAHVMDLHNNDIGRSHRYHSFRGHYFWDRWDWGEWARKVRDYVNNSANAEYIPEWFLKAPTTAEAWAREECVPDEKYIYFSVTSS